jgi:hypothetical protein
MAMGELGRGSRPGSSDRAAGGASSAAKAALGIALVLLASACTYNPRRPAAGWSAYDTRNVRVYTSTVIEHQYAQEWLETAYNAYRNSFFKDMKLRPLEAMFLQVEPGGMGRLFRPNDDPPASWALEGMPGGGRIGKDGLIVLTERRDYRGTSKQVAYQLIGQAIPHAPLWFRVGFGQYLSEYRVHYKGDRWMVCYGTDKGFLSPTHFANPSGSLAVRAQTMRNVPGRDILIPLDQVLEADWYRARDKAYWFNFTAYALVSYLIHGHDGWHASRFPLLLEAFRQGKSTAEALAAAYPHLLLDELDHEVTEYVRSPRKGVFWAQNPDGLCFRIPSGAYADKKGARSPVAEADVQEALEDLERMPLWRKYGSWYPTDVLQAESGPLKRKPVRGAKPGANEPAGGAMPPPGDPRAPELREPVLREPAPQR